ncbi:hypothetical protein [Micromonospora sp. NPDC049497]
MAVLHQAGFHLGAQEHPLQPVQHRYVRYQVENDPPPVYRYAGATHQG